LFLNLVFHFNTVKTLLFITLCHNLTTPLGFLSPQWNTRILSLPHYNLLAVSLNTSVEYLVTGAVQNSKNSIEIICRHLPKVQEHLEYIKGAVKELQYSAATRRKPPPC
jgi:hypothetical protein